MSEESFNRLISSEMQAHIESLQATIDEANAQEPVAEVYKNSKTGTGIDMYMLIEAPEGTTQLYANPIPSLQAQQVAAEAYQVIGALASDLFESKEVIRALDYFSAISCGDNPTGEMLPFLCDWERQSQGGICGTLWCDSHNEDEILGSKDCDILSNAVVNLWEDILCLKEDVTSKTTARQSQAVAVPDSNEAAHLLGVIFDEYENGIDCYSDYPECEDYIGKAFKINDELWDRCILALSASSHSSNPSPRITEQDAREIVSILLEDYREEYCGQSIDSWLESCAELLLNKLNSEIK